MKRFSQFLIILILLLVAELRAQDRHYWYQQYGGRSSMLGGAVIGDVMDNSATFYNPGALGFIENNMMSVSANAYNLAYYKLGNALGDGQDLKGFPFLLYPQLVGGFVPFVENQKWKWAYSMLTRNSSNFTHFNRYEDTRNSLPLIQGDEKFIAGYEIQSKKQEQWIGVSVGRMISDNLAFGATMFVAYKYISGYETAFYNTFPQTNTPLDANGAPVPFAVSKIEERRFYDIPIVSLIWKFGLSYQKDDWRLGLTATMPSLNLWFMKYGDSQRELTLSNVNFWGTFLTDYLEIGRQENRQTKMSSPFSFGFGLSKKIDNGKILFSGEYFLPLGTSQILEADNNTSITSTPGQLNLASVPNLDVSESYKRVLNLGIGFEYRILENIDLLTGIRTDFNNYAPVEANGVESPVEPYYSPWNLYHLTIGGNLIGDRSNITAGLQYTIGAGNSQQYQNFTDKSNSDFSNVLIQNLNQMDYLYNGFSITISYTYKFKED